MIVKRIICGVDPNTKDQFTIAQEKWSDLKNISGFVSQFGGWDLKNLNQACIISIWESLEAYKEFMKKEHDEIYHTLNQKNTFTKIQIELYTYLFGIGNNQNQMTIPFNSRVLRIAECHIFKEQEQNFIKKQQRIWNPAMEAATGMAGGTFSTDQKGNFLISSFWENLEFHDLYQQNNIPKLRAESNIIADTKSLQGRLIELVPSWSVAKQ